MVCTEVSDNFILPLKLLKRPFSSFQSEAKGLNQNKVSKSHISNLRYYLPARQVVGSNGEIITKVPEVEAFWG